MSDVAKDNLEEVVRKFPHEKQGILDFVHVIKLINEYDNLTKAVSCLKDRLKSLIKLQIEYIDFINLRGGKRTKYELETVEAGKELLGAEKPFSIKEEDFEKIPRTVRRRANYSEVVDLYEKIKKLAKRPGGTLERKDMIEEGLKIVGQTGEAKLAVLRYLNLISVGRAGTVALTNVIRTYKKGWISK